MGVRVGRCEGRRRGWLLALVVGLGATPALGLGCSSTDEGAGLEDTEGGIPSFQLGDVWAGEGGGAGGADGDGQGPGADPDGGGRVETGPEGADGGSGDSGGSGGGGRGEAQGGGFEYPCEPGTLEVCETVCGTSGVRQCLKDWGPCVPLAEQCGNCIDDDCNGIVDDNCPERHRCRPSEVDCPVAVISVAPSASVGVGTTLQLSAQGSSAPGSTVAAWQWSVIAPAGSTATFAPTASVQTPTFTVDLAGQYFFELRVWDLKQNESCNVAVAVVQSNPVPPVEPEVGCADGEREGFLALDQYPQIAACAGAWSEPGVSPTTVVPTCGRQGGDDGPNPDGFGCSAADLCAEGWRLCNGWQEVAAKSPTGCAGATPPGAAPKSLFFAIRQPSENDIVCGQPGDGYNDVFGCGNLGVGIGPDKGCGPLDRALASTQPNSCGFNEAQPNLGPWECLGGPQSHLEEGSRVTKKGCPGQSCSYDGQPVGSSDKGGVICCRDL